MEFRVGKLLDTIGLGRLLPAALTGCILDDEKSDYGWLIKGVRDGDWILEPEDGGPLCFRSPVACARWTLQVPPSATAARQALENALPDLEARFAKGRLLARYLLDIESFGTEAAVRSTGEVLRDLDGECRLSGERYHALLDDLENRGQIEACVRIGSRLKEIMENRSGRPAHAVRLRLSSFLRRLGRSWKAIAMTEYLLDRDPQVRPSEANLLAMLLTTRAAALLDVGRFDDADGTARRAWAIQPSEHLKKVFERLKAEWRTIQCDSNSGLGEA